MKRYSNNKILVITDTHLPYEHEKMWDFLRETKAKYKPDRVIHCGDLVDNYNASRYPKDPDHPDSWFHEMTKVNKKVARLARIFPEMEIMIGNHDVRYFSKASSAGIPTSIIKGFSEVVGAPEGWSFHDSLTLTVDKTRDQITFAHHRGANVFLMAQRLGRTLVTGHLHSKGKIEAFNNGSRVYYGINVPCLISGKGAPFSYTKMHNINPILGCLTITEGLPAMVRL